MKDLSAATTKEEVLAWMKANQNHDGWLGDYQTMAALQRVAELTLNQAADHVGALHQQSGSWVNANQASYCEAAIRDMAQAPAE